MRLRMGLEGHAAPVVTGMDALEASTATNSIRKGLLVHLLNHEDRLSSLHF